MTAKHFVRLATELAYARPIKDDSSEQAAALLAWQRAVKAVCIACKAANPQFDEPRFVAACEK